jgi:hypothetical protein
MAGYFEFKTAGGGKPDERDLHDEGCSRESNRSVTNGIASLKTNAPTAAVKDLTWQFA